MGDYKNKMSCTNRVKIYDKKYKTAELKISKILTRISSLKLDNAHISRLGVHHAKGNYIFSEKLKFLAGKTRIFVISSLFMIALLGLYWFYNEFSSEACLVELPSSSKTLFRPPEDCSMCRDLRAVVRVANITPDQFENNFAYSATPVIVTDAATEWKAMKEFDFNFFSHFYKTGKMGKQINDCFFFAYKSGFNSLDEVFEMEEKRSNLSGDPWYVGWSTCHDEESRRLRSYYEKPYFLPRTAESDMVDWIFMGGPGQGAHMHIDSVKHMSWQAQVRGRKRWQLAPPTECLYSCYPISFVVMPGEILVVNTNRWYHQTDVLPGDISITIGAEYD